MTDADRQFAITSPDGAGNPAEAVRLQQSVESWSRIGGALVLPDNVIVRERIGDKWVVVAGKPEPVIAPTIGDWAAVAILAVAGATITGSIWAIAWGVVSLWN